MLSLATSPSPFPSSPSPLLAALPELSQLVGELVTLVERPVPLVQWDREVRALYKHAARSTRLRMSQALRETIALAEPGATTAHLTADLVGRFAQREGRAATTNGLLSALRRACRVACKRHWLNRARLEDVVWRVPADAPRVMHHGRKAIARALAALKAAATSWEGHRLYAWTAVLAYTGLRKMEALRLRVDDVDLRRGFVFVRPNGRALKTPASAAPVPLPRVLRGILRPWLARCGSDWVFPNLARTGPWVGGSAGYRAGDRLKAAGAAVGVAGLTPHSLRHSLATHLTTHWRLGTKQVRLILRHANDRTQDGYIHRELVDLKCMVDGFDFDGPPRGDRPRGKAPFRRARRPRRRAG